MSIISKSAKRLIVFLLAATQSYFTFAQTDSLTAKYILSLNTKYPLILIDSPIGIKYILDSTRTQIKAITKTGKILWQNNPITEIKVNNTLDPPQFIVVFKLMKDKRESYKEKIFISTNSNYFGYINKGDGKYAFAGRD